LVVTEVINYAGSPMTGDNTSSFVAATSLSENEWTLNGSWQINPQYITSESSTSTLTFSVVAKDVYVVAGSINNQSETVSVSLPSSESNQYGSDVVNGHVMVTGSRLYHIVSLNQFGDTIVTLTVPEGVSLYTFTFGS